MISAVPLGFLRPNSQDIARLSGRNRSEAWTGPPAASGRFFLVCFLGGRRTKLLAGLGHHFLVPFTSFFPGFIAQRHRPLAHAPAVVFARVGSAAPMSPAGVLSSAI